MFIVLPFPVSFKFSAWLWSAYPWNTSCCRATQTPHEHSLSAPLSPLLAESLYRWKYCFLPIAKKGPSLPPWQIFCVCSNAKPKPHTCSTWSHHQPSKPGALQGLHTHCTKCWLQQWRLHSRQLRGQAFGWFSWISAILNPHWIWHYESLEIWKIAFS